jgi:NAD(P)-dependent dehydrogenase (short-subunit alcohol dehydrogenase family)
MNVNIRGYALMAKYIVPILKKQNSGSIINISSCAGLVAHSNFLPYSTTKGAIIQMTRNLALDLGSFNIRVNSISPGAIDSPTLYRTAAEGGLTKEQFDEEHGGKCIKRLGHPQEVANMIVFLVSDLCSFTTGANIVIDGGYTTV